jgi:hypothetical protein
MLELSPNGIDARGPDVRVVRAVEDFIDFLDDMQPPVQVADSLSLLLRTEPPILFGTHRVVDLVASWARKRESVGNERASDLMLGATRKIIEAYRSSILDGFDPKAFYRPFVLGIGAQCPADEHDEFHAGLRQLQTLLPKRWAGADDVSESVAMIEVRGRHLTLEAALGELTERLEGEPHMADARFEETLSDVERVLLSHGGDDVEPSLVRLAAVGVMLFNAVRVQRASRLFQAIADAMERLKLPKEDRGAIRSAISSSELDEIILFKWTNTPQRHAEIRPIVLHFADLDPEFALDALAGDETARDRRRFLLSVLVLHGASSLPAITARLALPTAAAPTWFLTRNLLYLLSHIEAPTRVEKRRIIDLIGPYVTGNPVQVRLVALAALKRLGAPREAIPYVARALDPTAYRPSIAGGKREALRRHLGQAMTLIARSHSPAALTVLAEIAVGNRGAGFGLGGELRAMAMDALANLAAPMPRPAALVIVHHLARQAARRVKLIVGHRALGLDVPGCQALLRVIADSPEPEARQLLDTAFMRRLAAGAPAKEGLARDDA